MLTLPKCKRRASFYGSRSLKIKTFSACDYMNSIQSKLSAVVLVLFFNQNPVGNLFTGQRPKYFISSKGTSAKSNDEDKKKTKLAHHISKYQTSKKPKYHLLYSNLQSPRFHLKSSSLFWPLKCYLITSLSQNMEP